MNTEKLVLSALKHKAPKLMRDLRASGELNEFVKDLADQIRSAVVNRSREIAQHQGYDRLMQADPMKAAGVMSMAQALAREEVHAQMLEFPPEPASEADDELTDWELLKTYRGRPRNQWPARLQEFASKFE